MIVPVWGYQTDMAKNHGSSVNDDKTYRPETERISHCVEARAADQFDALVQIDRTTALEPLERWALGDAVPDTIPSGL